MSDATRDARRAASFLRKEPSDGVRVLGPAFAVRAKVAGRYRSQILVKLQRSRHGRVRHLLRALVNDETMGRVMAVDVDPMTLS